MRTFTYSFSENRVYCMTFYAGKTVKGVAKRDPEDEFDLEAGKKLARARCNYKLRKKQLKNKIKRCEIAEAELMIAQTHARNAVIYKVEAEENLKAAKRNLKRLRLHSDKLINFKAYIIIYV